MTVTPVPPEERRLDWVSRHDPESRDYGIREIIPRGAVTQRNRAWRQGVVTDQGREGACVGHGWMTDLVTQPDVPSPMPTQEVANAFATAFYHRAQQIDEWEGEAYDGTSVLAGAKVMVERGFIGEYRWCFSVTEVRDAVLAEGPVVIGIVWREGMYETRPSGLVEVTGRVVGGHCLTLTGFNPKQRIKGETGLHEVFRWRNSWNADYGVNGSAYVKLEDLATLLADQGEACVPMKRVKPVLGPPPANVPNAT